MDTAAEPREVIIQRNPRAGSGCRERMLVDFVRRLKWHGLRPRVFCDRGRLDDWLRQPEHHRRVRCLVAAGGDGTIRDLVTRHPSVRLGLLPFGTENVLAKYLGIPRRGAAAADVIARGCTRRLDVGTIGQESFLLMVSVGVDAAVVQRVHARRTGRISRVNYFGPAVAEILAQRRTPVRVLADGELVGVGPQVLICNVPRYALGLSFAPHARDDDGRLDLRLFPRLTVRDTLLALWQAWRWQPGTAAGAVARSGVRFEITSDEPVAVQADGDPVGFTPVTVGIRPQACEVLVPAAVPGG